MKVIVVGSLWFISVWCIYELFVSAFGAPRTVGPLLGLMGSVTGFALVVRSRQPGAVRTRIETGSLGRSTLPTR
jgi:hypothetical protein